MNATAAVLPARTTGTVEKTPGSAASKKPFRYLPALDSFRTVACFVVIFFHSNTVTHFLEKGSPMIFFRGGYFGVDMFFVLSGFLITSILVNEFCITNDIAIRRFYLKRILRLYPPLLLAVALYLVPLLFVDAPMALSNIFFTLTYTADVAKLFQYLISGLQYPLLFSHTWSLAVEEQFYLVFPLLFLLLLRFSQKRQGANLLSSFPFFVCFFIAVIVVSTLVLGAWFYKFFGWRFLEIFYGAYIALVFSEAYKKAFPSTGFAAKVQRLAQQIHLNKYVYWISLFGLLYFLNFELPFSLYNLQYFLVVAVSAVLIVNFATQKNTGVRVNRLLTNRWMVYAGKISYGLYLFHAPIFRLQNAFFQNVKVDVYHSLAYDAAAVALTLVVAVFSYAFMEKRILRYKAQLG